MNISVNKQNGILIVSITGEIDMYESPLFHEQYLSLSATNPACAIIIDLQKTTYIDSSGIGVLFRIFSDAKERNVLFCMCNTIGMVEKLLRLSHMSSILPIEKNLACAIERVKVKS